MRFVLSVVLVGCADPVGLELPPLVVESEPEPVESPLVSTLDVVQFGATLELTASVDAPDGALSLQILGPFGPADVPFAVDAGVATATIPIDPCTVFGMDVAVGVGGPDGEFATAEVSILGEVRDLDPEAVVLVPGRLVAWCAASGAYSLRLRSEEPVSVWVGGAFHAEPVEFSGSAVDSTGPGVLRLDGIWSLDLTAESDLVLLAGA